jgi:hypothetical protein
VINANRRVFPSVQVAVLSLVPPLNSVENPAFPKNGTLQQRVHYTCVMNQGLEKMAQCEGVKYLDINKYFRDAAGSMCPELSDGNCHAAAKYYDLVEYATEKAFGS